MEGSRARTGSPRRQGARGEMAWQGRLPSSLTFIREEREAWAPHPPDGGFLAFNFLATGQWGRGDRTVSQQDFLHDTWLVQGRVCVGSSLTTQNKKTAQNSWISLLCTPRKGEKDSGVLRVRLREGEAAPLRAHALHDRAGKGQEILFLIKQPRPSLCLKKKSQKDAGKRPAGEGKVRKVQGGRARWRGNCE